MHPTPHYSYTEAIINIGIWRTQLHVILFHNILALSHPN